MISCYSHKTLKAENARDLSSMLNNVREATVKVEVESLVMLCFGEDLCMPQAFAGGSGTGVLIEKTDDYSLIYTAGHICDTNSMLPLPPPPAEGVFYKTESAFKILDTNLKEYTNISQMFIDPASDSCIIQLGDKLEFEPLKMAKKNPEYGYRYYNVGAPLGLFDKESAIIGEGIYSGRYQTHTSYGEDYADAYSFSISGGSSGSPIVNDVGELIGIAYSHPRDFKGMAFSVRREKIQTFIESVRLVL